jgi:hypothetical protein
VNHEASKIPCTSPTIVYPTFKKVVRRLVRSERDRSEIAFQTQIQLETDKQEETPFRAGNTVEKPRKSGIKGQFIKNKW